MNKETDKIEFLNHNINITERQNVQVSGVTEIDSFDNEEFLLETTAGLWIIKSKKWSGK